MIIIKLCGGLGNQMFQYAASRHLAELCHTDIKFDTHWFDTYDGVKTHLKYRIDCFNVQAEVATDKEIKSLTGRDTPKVLKKWNNFFERKKKWKNKKVYKEPHFHFDPNFFKLSRNVYLDGYFQSCKYFSDIEYIIHKEFTFRSDAAGKNKEWLDLIREKKSISLHVRRGDYAMVAEVQQKHGGICTPEYYKNCIETVIENVQNPHFFVFSDDISWVKEHIKIDAPATYISGNTEENDFEDMRLMSNCKHNIIANSTFSFWGAWLNNNPEKIVFAPKKWFNDSAMNTDDIMPREWERI